MVPSRAQSDWLRFVKRLVGLTVVPGFDLLMAVVVFGAEAPASFTDVTPAAVAHGFRATAVYLNDAGQPFGGRFIHQKTGFTLDLIQIQSVLRLSHGPIRFPSPTKESRTPRNICSSGRVIRDARSLPAKA